MKIVELTKEFIVEEERDFDSSHASTLLQLENGDIISAWFGGSWEKGMDVNIYLCIRTENGWERPRCIAQERTVAMWNPVLFQKQDGTIQLFYKVGEAISQWKTYIIMSADGGVTWTDPRELVEGDCSGGRGPVKNKPIRLKNGDVLAPASLEGGTWDAFVDISTDDGETWEKSDLVPVRKAGYNIQMIDQPYSKYRCFGKGIIQPTLWQDEGGDVHMFLRSTSSRIFRSDSDDNGRSWSLAYATSLPNNNSGIDLVKLPENALALVYNPTDNLPNYYKGPRTPLTVAYSKDNGESWEDVAVLEDGPGDFAYPSVICNENKEILITYTWKRERIVFVKMKYEM